MKTKTKWKKLLSLLLICMMLVSLLPTVAFAAEQTLIASKNGTGWEYDHDTKTLTLTDYTGTDLFHSDFDLTVNLAGNNTINYDGTTASQYYPIYAKNVTFTGSGTLNIILSTGNKDFYLNLAGVRALEKITKNCKCKLDTHTINFWRKPEILITQQA